MNKAPAPLDRRGFLRLCVLAVGGAFVAACQQRLNDVAVMTEVPPSPTLSIKASDQGVWTWVKPVRVVVSGKCEAVLIRVNNREFTATQAGDEFTADVELTAGENRLNAACRQLDGTEVQSNMLNYTERLRQVPRAVITIALNDGKILLDSGESKPAEGNESNITDYVWSARGENPATLTLEGAGGLETKPFLEEVSARSLVIQPPREDGEYYVHLEVKDDVGRQDGAGIYFVVEQGKVRIPDYDREHPAWVETAVVYGVVPGKFGQPAFNAITKRMDKLAELGITALWLAPINLSPPGDYGYAVVDYFELNPGYGSRDDFHHMVQEAHARGLRVLMDFVPNHSSAQHPYFLSAQAEGPGSPYWDFYDRDASGEPTHYFDWTHLPNLNYENPEVRRWMVEAFAYWVREFDLDGFRVDACWGVKQRRPDFWPAWRRELKRIKPDLMLLAEASARDPYWFDNGFDVAYDWTSALGKWAWQVVWDAYKFRLLAYNLTHALTNGDEGYHEDALIFRFLNNNDTGQRFITRHGPEVTRVATALLLTLPGVPCIYTGDELGEEFHPYQDPGPLAWIERVPGLRDYHKQLIALRQDHPSLHSRQWMPLTVVTGREDVAFGYLRYHDEYLDPVLVLLNFTADPAELTFTLPEEFSSLADVGTLRDLLTGEPLVLTDADGLNVTIPGFGVLILTA
jgi:cyclomaltodextrinase / maltogenic alpha-amylase / neopullulanase